MKQNKDGTYQFTSEEDRIMAGIYRRRETREHPCEPCGGFGFSFKGVGRERCERCQGVGVRLTGKEFALMHELYNGAADPEAEADELILELDHIMNEKEHDPDLIRLGEILTGAMEWPEILSERRENERAD